MVQSVLQTLRPSTAAFVLAAALLAGCNGGGLNSQPRITTVPTQTVTSGATVTVDISDFVTDKEGAALSYSVVSGGGSFAGSTYSQTFTTMGTYAVTVRVTDAGGKSSDTSFQVVVRTASFAVVQAASGLRLVDTGTRNVVMVSDATGFTDTFRAFLSHGVLVYERTIGSDKNLYAFDAFTRATSVLGASATSSEQFGAKTSDGKVVFTTGTTTDRDLFVWNSRTGVTRPISAQVGEHDRNPFVNSADLVFFERGAAGQADIWVYDPATDNAEPISEALTNETLVATLNGGAVVFGRVGAGGETDLFSYKVGVGLVEIGADLAAPLPNQTKTYKGQTSDGKVVFEVTQPTTTDLYIWNPANGASRLIAANATLASVTPVDHVVYYVLTGPSNRDLAHYDYATNVSTTIANSGDDERFDAASSDGHVAYSLFAIGDSSWDLHWFDVDTLSSTTIANAGADDFTFQTILANGKLVYLHEAATPELFLFDPAGPSSLSIASGNDVQFGGEMFGGDFCFTQLATGQRDLLLWDESAVAVETISGVAGNDAFGAAVVGGDILFTRVPTGQTTADLFFFDLSANDLSRLTTTEVTHVVITSVTADRAN
jgi:hypothetical protein